MRVNGRDIFGSDYLIIVYVPCSNRLERKILSASQAAVLCAHGRISRNDRRAHGGGTLKVLGSI